MDYTSIRNAAEKVEQAGFELTGEYRSPKSGEYYVCSTFSDEGAVVGKSDVNWSKMDKRFILRRKKRTFEFDGQTFECPEGFEFERVGVLGPKDEGKYVGYSPGVHRGLVTATLLEQYSGVVYFIFRKLEDK